jgi:hypothetical protein
MIEGRNKGLDGVSLFANAQRFWSIDEGSQLRSSCTNSSNAWTPGTISAPEPGAFSFHLRVVLRVLIDQQKYHANYGKRYRAEALHDFPLREQIDSVAEYRECNEVDCLHVLPETPV